MQDISCAMLKSVVIPQLLFRFIFRLEENSEGKCCKEDSEQTLPPIMSGTFSSMLSSMISQRVEQWFLREDCPAKQVVEYIEQAGFFRNAQIDAIKTYLFLKIEGANRPLSELFSDGALMLRENLSRLPISEDVRALFEKDNSARTLFEFSRTKTNGGSKTLLPEVEKYLLDHAEEINCDSIIKRMFYGVEYPDYLFSLPMGAGKTYLMAAFIYLDLYFAQNDPANKIFAHNFILMIPSGQAILNNITRTRRVLRYKDNNAVYDHIRRGLPLYEVTETEVVGTPETKNLLLRGECLSACAYLKDKGITVDLVYIDPPFASGADYAKKVFLRRNPHKAEQIAQAEDELELDELRAFEEKMYGDIWNKEDYLNWMFENLTAIKSVMSETGSIYVHIGVHISHYVKILMDEIFGDANFRNEIVVRRTKKSIRENEHVKTLNNATDSIFLYVLNESTSLLPPTKLVRKEERWHAFDAPELRSGMDYDLFGTKPPLGRHWMRSLHIVEEWINEGKLRPHPITGRPEYRLDASDHMVCDSLWEDIAAYSFDNDYATEKSPVMLERIIKASSKKQREDGTPMVVADFFGGSGVTVKVAHDLGRQFVHVDVGVNSLQTARDRLRESGAAFRILDIQDGVSLFRNPVQTMDKLKTLITGLKNEDSLDKFWEGAIHDPKLGLVPVYLPNLLDHQTKVLDIPLMNRILQEALPELPDGIRQVIVYYVDIIDQTAVEKFIKEENMTGVEIALRDLKTILDEVVLNDIVEYTVQEAPLSGYEVEITRFASDRLQSKIAEYNQKKGLTGKAKSSLLEDDEDNGSNEAVDKEAVDEAGDDEPVNLPKPRKKRRSSLSKSAKTVWNWSNGSAWTVPMPPGPGTLMRKSKLIPRALSLAMAGKPNRFGMQKLLF